jgi:hypothetical protein
MSSTRPRGRTTRGRARADLARIWERTRGAPEPLSTVDHGATVEVPHALVAPEISHDGWIEPFLGANADVLARLDLHPEVSTTRTGACLRLLPGARLGAMPLRSAVTRRVALGIVVRSRFEWEGLGRVLGGVSFRVEPDVGGAAMVPGSAREVPPWILAGPVLARMADVLRHAARRFEFAREVRQRPRGTVDWGDYARVSLPSGAWQRFRCTFPDLSDDTTLFASMRWTIGRVRRELERVADAPVGRALLDEALILLHRLGTGTETRPTAGFSATGGQVLRSGWLAAAWEAMGWVADERGLGGEQTLDGLPWSLRADALWEAWVESWLEDVARRLGARLLSGRRGETRRALEWHGRPRTLSHLVPDFVLVTPEHHVFVDAKYKPHLMDVRRMGWDSVSQDVRDAHRADVHQALAYSALSPAPRVDTVLAYPVPSSTAAPPLSEADLPVGPRRARLILAGLPFGFSGPSEREGSLGALERLLRSA